MVTIIKDGKALDEITTLPYHDRFMRFDRQGKKNILGNAINIYHSHQEKELAAEEREFCELLNKAVGPSGIVALFSTIIGEGTYSHQRTYGIIDIAKETKKILEDKKYRNVVNTWLSKDPEQLEMWAKFHEAPEIA
jgi:hypothetical protein